MNQLRAARAMSSSSLAPALAANNMLWRDSQPRILAMNVNATMPGNSVNEVGEGVKGGYVGENMRSRAAAGRIDGPKGVTDL